MSSSLRTYYLQPSGVAYYSYVTQEIANKFPRWMKIRTDKSSIGQGFINPFGMQVEHIERKAEETVYNDFLTTAKLSPIDYLYKINLAKTLDLDYATTYSVVGNRSGTPITLHQVNEFNTFGDNLQLFSYEMVPTAIASGLLQSSAPEDLTLHTTEIPFDVDTLNSFGDQQTTYVWVNPDTKKLEFFYYTNEEMEVPLSVPPLKEVVSSYTLQAHDNLEVIYPSGDYIGSSLAGDQLLFANQDRVLLFNVRAPLIKNTEDNWAHNAENTTILSTASYDLPVMTAPSGLAWDGTNRAFWIQNNNSYTSFDLLCDYFMVDPENRYILLRENYSEVTVDGVSATPVVQNIWNHFDEFGLILDTPRNDGEKNYDYRQRLLDVFKFRSNSTYQGIINSVSRDLDLTYYGGLEQGTYPEGLFASGIFYAGYNIYPSGVPDNVLDMAKIDAINTDYHYGNHVDINNVPDATLADYTDEILRTYPIVWGSGTTDPYGFIWDLGHFDGSFNSAKIVPDFMGNLFSGVPSLYFQSGVEDPTTDALTIRLSRNEEDEWYPEVKSGVAFIHDKPYYIFADPRTALIPSGVQQYILPDNYLEDFPVNVYDPSGYVTGTSGYQFLSTSVFGDATYEFIPSGHLILFETPISDALEVCYETSSSGWCRLPWDLNPLHGNSYDGFVWISDHIQQLDALNAMQLTVNPDELYFGMGGAACIAKVLDTDGQPVIGARIDFTLSPTTLGALTNTTAWTQFDGAGISFYQPPSEVYTQAASGIAIVDTPVWEILPMNPGQPVQAGGQALVWFKDKLWAFGGYEISPATTGTTVTNNIYSMSPGARYWDNYGSNTAWQQGLVNARATADVDRAWLYGGIYMADASGTVNTYSNDIWYTDNGYTWFKTTASSNIPATRTDFSFDFFLDGLYLIGGRTPDTGVLLADSWKTTDGVHWTEIIDNTHAARYGHVTYQLGSRLYVTGGFDAGGNPIPATCYTENGVDWVNLGNANIHISNLSWSAKLGNKVYGLYTVDGYVYETTDMLSWTRVYGAPVFYGNSLQGIGINEIGTIYIMGRNTDPNLGFISSLRTMQYARKVLFDKDMTGVSATDIITVSETTSPSNPDPRPIVWLQNAGATQVTIQPQDWTASGYLDNAYAGKYVIGLSSQEDSWYNIDTKSLFVNDSDAVENSAESDFNYLSAWCYAVDAYNSPEEYGKILLYCKTIPGTPTTVTFNTYSVVKPDTIEITPSGAMLTYPAGECRTDESLVIKSIAPSKVTIIASGIYEDMSLGTKNVTVSLTLASAQQNVMRLDNRFIDYFSYLRKS